MTQPDCDNAEMVETTESPRSDGTTPDARKPAWPLALVLLYIVTLIVAAVGELFEIPAILNFFLFR